MKNFQSIIFIAYKVKIKNNKVTFDVTSLDPLVTNLLKQIPENTIMRIKIDYDKS